MRSVKFFADCLGCLAILQLFARRMDLGVEAFRLRAALPSGRWRPT